MRSRAAQQKAQQKAQRKAQQRKQQQQRRPARQHARSEPRLVDPVEMPANQGAAPCAGLLPYVRFLRGHLHLPLLLAGLAVKEKGYRLVSLVLVLLCRPQLGCASINQLRARLAHRFIQRLFTLSYGPQRGASVDILYDLLAQLDPTLLEQGFTRHLQQLRRRGLLSPNRQGYLDSTLMANRPHTTFENAAWTKMRGVSFFGFKLFLLVDIATKTLLYVRFATMADTDVNALIPAVQAVQRLGFQLTHLGFDRGFWSGDNFKFLQRQRIAFFTVLKNYQQEHRDLLQAITSRTPQRQRLKDGVWITEVEPICLNTYFTTKTLRCIVVRQKGHLPWAIITNELQFAKADIVRFYEHRNLVEKLIEELKNDYALQKLPRKAFRDNTCYVLLTLWSYNLLADYKLTVLKNQVALFQQLKSLRSLLFDFAAVVFYRRCGLYLSFEITHPLQANILAFNRL